MKQWIATSPSAVRSERRAVARARAWLALTALALTALDACGGMDTPPTMMAVTDSADQVLYGLKHNLTVDGVLRAHLEADTAYFYQASQRADLLGVKVIFYSPQGVQTSTLTSDSGTYDWRTGNMEARGNVVAVTPDHRRLTTSVLRYDRRSDQISGPNAFVFNAPDRQLEGESFTSDPEFKNVLATKPRHGLVRPQRDTIPKPQAIPK
jgi:LPS export ABC transporter protein LptC